MPSFIVAAESFFLEVTNGVAFVRGFDQHVLRFRKSVIKMLGSEPTELNEFLCEVPSLLSAKDGKFFPRIECINSGTELRFNAILRPLPILKKELDIVATNAEKHANADIKGPNIEAYSALNKAKSGETLLLSTDGLVLETTTTALLWWNGDVINTVASVQRVASITEKLVLGIARECATETKQSSITPHELSDPDLEVWALNALHGIRSVSNFLATPKTVTSSTRLQSFKQKYHALKTGVKSTL